MHTRQKKYQRLHSCISRKWEQMIFLTVLWCICYIAATTQTLSPGNTRTFSLFSSKTHQTVQFSNLAEWEQYRWQLKQNMEAVMGPLPDRSNLPDQDVRIKDTVQTDLYTRYEIDFLAAAGERVPAYLYLPHRSSVSGKMPAMLALHPTGAEGKKIVDGQGKANRGYAKELAERGYVVIAPDYPSFGDLSDYDFNTDRYQSGTMAAIHYHMRCVDLLSSRPDVDRERIGVIGHSLGGHNAMFVGAFDERLKVVVTSSGWTQMEYYDIGPSASERYGGRLGPYAQDRYMPLVREKYKLDGNLIPINYHEMIALLAPRAFFSNSPINDANFDVKGVIKGMKMAEEVFQFFGAGDQLQVRYPEAEHDFPTKVRLEAYEFIDHILHHIPNEHDIE